VTFDIGGLRDRLLAQAREPNQSLASIVRMAVLDWVDQQEIAESDRLSKISQDSENS
jgi:predicted DNA-binding ribbon-helix-helix protein